SPAGKGLPATGAAAPPVRSSAMTAPREGWGGIVFVTAFSTTPGAPAPGPDVGRRERVARAWATVAGYGGPFADPHLRHAVVAAQIAALGSFETFLLALVLAGLIQVGLGLARGGFVAAFFPSAVVKGLLAAIGVILVLKQLPHVVGHDPDPEGDLAFVQPDRENTFSALVAAVGDLDLGAALIGLGSVVLLAAWDRSKRLKESP